VDILPAQFRVLVPRRPKYACRTCEDGVVQAPVPARLIEGGLPTEATVSQILVSRSMPSRRRRCPTNRCSRGDWTGQSSSGTRGPSGFAVSRRTKRSDVQTTLCCGLNFRLILLTCARNSGIGGTGWGELRHICKDGSKVVVESRMQLFSDSLVLEANRDITKRIDPATKRL
jgi:hypothetical protein